MSSFKSNENIHKKEDGSYYVVSAKTHISDSVMTWQRKREVTYRKFANFKYAVDSKTETNQNGVQIIKSLTRI